MKFECFHAITCGYDSENRDSVINVYQDTHYLTIKLTLLCRVYET